MIIPHGSEQLTPKIVNTDEERVALLDSAKSMKKMQLEFIVLHEHLRCKP